MRPVRDGKKQHRGKKQVHQHEPNTKIGHGESSRCPSEPWIDAGAVYTIGHSIATVNRRSNRRRQNR
ncbi:MAG: hypothetical protein WCI02_03770 [Planctomycetota bacterium]